MNPALTVVLLGLLPLVRRWSLLRRGFPFPSLDSDVLGSLVLLLANQLSSPAQKQVMRLVNAAIVLGFSWPRCLASHSSQRLCLKAAKASVAGQSTIWFFLVRNLFQSFRADSGLLIYMTQIVRIRRSDISPLKIGPKSILKLLLTSY